VRVFVRAEQLEFVWIPLNVDEIDEMDEIIATVVHRRKIAIALFLIIEKLRRQRNKYRRHFAAFSFLHDVIFAN